MPKKKNVAESADQTLTIQFVGRRREINKKTGKERLVVREAPTQRVNGSRVFDLPSDSDQKKGFTHPDAALLLRLYKGEFKKKVSKGKSK